MKDRIEAVLREAFAPSLLEVINDSARHHGHAGDDGSGESHFTVKIVSEAFVGQSRLQRQRAVFSALVDEMNSIHALSIDAAASQDRN
ncbi:MAG: BolA family transcriptional regulator [Alphaproteobacteria bacterium]|nr:BolA family transcriptional regulator [Alphaproteobacteria bacterium]